ncbi:MAG: hypothetical protein EOO88_60140, partial [Pedobacter sp.]
MKTNTILRNLLFALAFTLSIISCGSNDKKAQTSASTLSQTATSENEVTKVPFREGRIDLKITTPGSGFGELLQQVDPSKGNVSAQMKKLAEKKLVFY